MLWPDDVTDEQLALAAAKCDEDEQTREGNSNESFVFWISSYYFNLRNLATNVLALWVVGGFVYKSYSE